MRPHRSFDIDFILSSWLKSQRGVPHYTMIHDSVFYPGQKRIILRLMDDPSCKFTMAVNRSDPDTIYGWICTQPGILHYMYVKHAFRNMGIGKMLLQHNLPTFGTDETVVTHISNYYAFRQSRYRLSFVPYLVGQA